MNRTAIVIPIYKDFESLDIYEHVSLTQLERKFSQHDVFFITYPELDSTKYSLKFENKAKVITFDKLFFESIAGYNRLLMQVAFYKAFSEYEYLLICQLDVFVFSDMLEHFTQLGYDYIGAPWFESFGSTTNDNKILGVGNGGFSLRKVSSVLRILDFFEAFKKPLLSVARAKALAQEPVPLLKTLKHERIRRKHGYPSILPWQHHDNEDIYWSMYIPPFFPWYKVSTVEDAMAFAFETRPELLYTLNNNKLPMGVHAWQKYNPEFWKPYIERLGYTL